MFNFFYCHPLLKKFSAKLRKFSGQILLNTSVPLALGFLRRISKSVGLIGSKVSRIFCLVFLIDASKPKVEKKNYSNLIVLLRGVILFVFGLLAASKTLFKRYEKTVILLLFFMGFDATKNA